MKIVPTIDKIVQKSLEFIESQQDRKGSFLSLTSPKQNDFTDASSYNTTFITAQILNCLDSVKTNTLADKISSRAVKFLLLQKNSQWSFNYWQRGSLEALRMPYPDDLDDTFSALAAIWLYDPKLISGKALHDITRLLIATESKVGGPYRTWIVPKSSPKQWLDVDVAVNANVAYFLFQQQVSLPGLDVFFDRMIAEKKLTSVYYPNVYPGVYFLSRLYNGSHKQRLINLLLSKRKNDFSWGNALNTALSLSSLINLGYDKSELNGSVKYIMKKFNGANWPAYAFCLDPAKNGKKYYAGSEALTTAFCINALIQYKNSYEARVAENKNDKLKLAIYEKITSNLKKRLLRLGDDFKDSASYALEKIEKDKLITLLPFLFYKSLKAEGNKVNDKTITSLGQINAYGWIAYNIYDNFLDGEGNPKLLSLANICLREVADGYQRIFVNESKNYEYIKVILDGIDRANAWEINHCKIDIRKGRFATPKTLPDFKNLSQLANKSLGHALGPITILLLKGFDRRSSEVKNLTQYFIHYIIARQLNDDAHDWLEDLKSGRINYANSLVLRQIKKRDVNLKADEENLKNIFWSRVISVVAHDIFYHTNQARIAIKKIDIFSDAEIFDNLLKPFDLAAQKALTESTRVKEFLTRYKQAV